MSSSSPDQITRPRVSVIIPNFNHAPFLRQRVDSVLAQTFIDFELLILDDCSTDDSLNIIKSYANDSRVSIKANEVNSGSTFKQWLKGLDSTSGEFIWFAESDDSACPDFLSTMIAQMDLHPNVGIAYCESLIIDEKGGVSGTTHDNFKEPGDKRRWRLNFVNKGKEEIRRYLSHQNTIPNASAVLIRRRHYLASAGVDTSMRLCGDWKFWVNMLLVSDIAHIAKPLNLFRTHKHNVRWNTQSYDIILESIKVLKLIESAVPLEKERRERILNKLAIAWTNAWLLHASPGKVTCARALTELLDLDPKFRRRLIGQAALRGISYIIRGRFLNRLTRFLPASSSDEDGTFWRLYNFEWHKVRGRINESGELEYRGRTGYGTLRPGSFVKNKPSHMFLQDG